MVKKIVSFAKSHTLSLVSVAAIAVIGVIMMLVSRAATPVLSLQPEAGTITAPATRVADTTASGGAGVKFGAGTVTPPTPPPTGGATEPNLKVAFVGDTVISSGTKSVLSLIKNENAHLLVHLGDFDYTNNPGAWDAQANSILGTAFPQVGVLGNHESGNYSGYSQAIGARQQRAAGAGLNCTGSPGIQAECVFKGLRVLAVAPGQTGSGHDVFLKNKLAASTNLWNICAWHENMNQMQPGGKASTVGWPVYEECRMGAGMPFAGHEHSYGRTKTLTSMSTQTVDATCNNPASVCVAKGKTFSTVNGLGGRTAIDPQSRCTPTTYPYGCKGEWAKFYTSSQGATFAVLFITFNVNGNPNKAHGYLKAINGQTVDQFDITRQ